MVEDPSADFLEHLQLIQGVLASRFDAYDVVVVANGVGPHVRRSIEDSRAQFDCTVTSLTLACRVPLSVCLRAALSVATGEVLLVCGSYQKITRDSLEEMLSALDAKTHMVVPNRIDRIDSTVGQVQSHMFNAFARWMTGTSFRDLNCNIRVFRRSLIEGIELYGDMYRFLPILAFEQGFRVKELDCVHFRELGRSGFFGFREYAGRLVDLLVLYFRTGHVRRPLRLFGVKGAVFLATGILMLLVVGLQRLFGTAALGNSPSFLLALLLLLFGVQVASIGLVGELVAFAHGRKKKPYVIDTVI